MVLANTNMLLFSPIGSFIISFSVNDASHDMEWGAEPPQFTRTLTHQQKSPPKKGTPEVLKFLTPTTSPLPHRGSLKIFKPHASAGNKKDENVNITYKLLIKHDFQQNKKRMESEKKL